MKHRIFSRAFLDRFKGFFTRNLGLKIVAFVFAILLWAYVLVALNPVRSKSISDVPITLEGYTDLMSRNLILVNSDFGLADVEVNATITNHADLDSSRVNCRASLGTISAAGTYRLPLSVTVQSNLGTVASVNPRTVTVEVDNLVVKTVPVKLELVGTLPEGYEVVSESMANSLTIEGAARFIEPTVRAVATVDLTGRTENVEESVDVTFYDKNDNQVSVVTRSQNTPNVTVRLSLSAFKRVSVQQAVSLADDAYHTLVSEVSPSSVVVYGDSDVLATIESLSTQSLVLPAESGVVSRELSLLLPEGVTLKRGQSSSVVLSAVVTEKTGERVFEVPLTYTHLSENLLIADGAPTFATVVAAGPLRQLDQLTADQLVVYADLTGYGPGDWELVPVIQSPSAGKFPGVTVALREQHIQLTLLAVVVEEPAPAPEPTMEPTEEPTEESADDGETKPSQTP
jgi:YbbR domain-containing protein